MKQIIITLTEEEIEIFNAYINDCMDEIAFGNSDWDDVYRKIVGENVCKKYLDVIRKIRDEYYN